MAEAPERLSSNAAPMTVGAVDLGSNSFHMVLAQIRDQSLHVIDRLREPVCLAAGFDKKRRLSAESQDRAIACLERFGQRLREIPPNRLRAVGTNSLRRARDARAVRGRFEEALGHPIEIIGGQEEARLIYLGVHGSDFAEGRRLVIDIGGGSTEVIVGEGADLLRAHSLFMGCVKQTGAHFSDGALTREAFRAAEIDARLELQSVASRLLSMGWQSCVGSSGTVASVEEILRTENGKESGITLAGLKRLRKTMIKVGTIDALKFPGVRSDRARVLPGGVAILTALFKSLKIESMTATGGALREGVLFDLLGRIRHEDIRDHTVHAAVRRYQVDAEQAERVVECARGLLEQLQGWTDPESDGKALAWAARLHEIGLAVSYTGYHRHGAYLVGHADLPGFSADDQRLVATLIRAHRRKLDPVYFAELSGERGQTALRLAIVLRLAVLLQRGRGPTVLPRAEIDPAWKELSLTFPADWRREHPLSAADLRREAAYLKTAGVKLRVSSATS